MTLHLIKSNAKVNLALNIISKSKKLHKIETLISFLKLHDLIHFKEIKSKTHKVFFWGKFSKNISNKNTIIKLLNILDKKNLLKNRKFQFKIKKNIPQQAGLGGGSMNAASILSFLIKKKIIKTNKKTLSYIANYVGSDVALGLKMSNSIMLSNNKILRFKNYKRYFVLVVKPNFGCSTKYVYSKVKRFVKPFFYIKKKKLFDMKNLKKLKNGLEEVVFKSHPKLKKVKTIMEKLNEPLFVRMSGSGSVLVAYYYSKNACNKARSKFIRQFKNYWCITSKTI